jgi:hypothetical protein
MQDRLSLLRVEGIKKLCHGVLDALPTNPRLERRLPDDMNVRLSPPRSNKAVKRFGGTS